MTLSRWLQRSGFILLTLIIAGVLGEVWLRVAFLPTIEYVHDSELGFRYAPNQRGIVWQGNYSTPSPLITINSAGRRGSETRRCPVAIAAIGSSEVVGPGLLDSEPWPVVLEKKLHETMPPNEVEVINAGTGGYGPAHHAIVMKRLCDQQKLAGAIVRVSLGDRNFALETGETKRSGWQQLLRDNSRLAKFGFNKLMAQKEPFRRAFVPLFLRPAPAASLETSDRDAKRMWEEYRDSWQAMARMAEEQHIELIFLANNPTNSPGEAYLRDRLHELSNGLQTVSVLEIGPTLFGLDAQTYPSAVTLFEKQWTLGFDPHANASQHRVIAHAVFEHLKSRGIVKSSTR